MRESDIQRSVIVALEAHGAYVVRVVVAGRAGTPDLIACYEGRYVAMEVKTDTGRLTPLQLVESQRVRAAGGEAYVVRSAAEALAALTNK